MLIIGADYHPSFQQIAFSVRRGYSVMDLPGVISSGFSGNRLASVLLAARDLNTKLE